MRKKRNTFIQKKVSHNSKKYSVVSHLDSTITDQKSQYYKEKRREQAPPYKSIPHFLRYAFLFLRNFVRVFVLNKIDTLKVKFQLQPVPVLSLLSYCL